MKMTAVALTLALATVAAVPARAALEYDYVQTARSNGDEGKPTDLTAHAVIDGQRVRLDFVAGNTYPPGTYMISTDAMQRMMFVDPLNKSYTEVNSSAIVSAIATSNIKIENVRSTVTKLEDKQMIANVSADHYRLALNYDITVTFRSMPLKQSVQTIIDQWTTVQFGDMADSAVIGNSLLTGNPEVDKVIALETNKIQGFPLKQRIQTTTVNQARAVSGSELKLPSTHTITREVTVTSIRKTPTTTAQFDVPSGYRRNDGAQAPGKAPMQVLQLDGTAK